MRSIKMKHIDALINGNAGAMASIVSTVILYPFENIKTRMQISQKGSKELVLIQSEELGLLETIEKILEKEGIAGFYRGMTPLLIGNYISYGVYFFWYEYFKRKLKVDPNQTFAVLQPSFFSAVLTTVVTNPFWVIQSKQTLSKVKDKLNFYQMTKKMIQIEGIQSLFKGLFASLVLVINPIVQFIIYELFKKKFAKFPYRSFVYFFGGALSKAIATLLTYPYQVVRTYAHIDKNKTDYIELFQEILKHNGIKGLFRGFTAKLTQSVLNSAFMLMFYEEIVNAIQNLVWYILKNVSMKNSVEKIVQ